MPDPPGATSATSCHFLVGVPTRLLPPMLIPLRHVLVMLGTLFVVVVAAADYVVGRVADVGAAPGDPARMGEGVPQS